MQEVDPGVQSFLEEADELLTDLEDSLLSLEENPEDKDVVASVFRDLHTIKSCGDMFGFSRVSGFVHKIEDLFDLIRSEKLAVTDEVLSITLKARDELKRIIEDQEFTGELDAAQNEILSEIEAAVKTQEDSETVQKDEPSVAENPVATAEEIEDFEAVEVEDETPSEPEPGLEEASGVDQGATGKAMFWVMYHSDEELGEDTIAWIENEMSGLGPFARVPDPKKTDSCCRYDFLLCSEKGQDAVKDIFLMVPQPENTSYYVLGNECVETSDMGPLLDCIESKRDLEPKQLAAALEMIFIHVLDEVRARRKSQPEQTKKVIPPEEGQKPQANVSNSIRVDADKLDKLINMVGELVIVQSRLTKACHTRKDSVLNQISEDLERLTDTMREDALNIRMMPIGTSFGPFSRMVREVSAELGKDAELVTIGADTELDKTIIDKLKDPITHILRNCLDHGLETPDEREELGKPRQGTITLSAGHQSGDVILTVKDDGHGVDLDKVRDKAVQTGLASVGDELNEQNVYSLVFEPGFSTAEPGKGISGRGMGMDFVKKTVDSLRGRVDIVSVPGEGTSVTLRLPLTLAILDGLMVKVGSESFILPLSSVQACQERMIEGDVKELEVIDRMGKLIPCLSLRRMLDVPGDQPDYERIVVAGVDGDYVGLAVDVVVGRQQAVIKSLSETCEATDWVSGTTVNADGGISLILDVQQIVRYAAEKKELLQ